MAQCDSALFALGDFFVVVSTSECEVDVVDVDVRGVPFTIIVC